MNAPARLPRIKHSDGARLVGSLRELDDILVKVAQPAEDRLRAHRATEANPRRAALQALSETLMRHAPAAVNEIEITRTGHADALLKSMIQLTSQPRPSSDENACVHCA